MAWRRFVGWLLARGAWTGVYATAGWGVVGVLLWFGWGVTRQVQGGRPDWSTVGIAWLVVWDVVAITGVCAGYWFGRAAHRRLGLRPYWLMPGRASAVIGNSWSVGLLVSVFVLFVVDGVPVWLTVFTVVATVNALAAEVDNTRVIKSLGRTA